MLPIVSFFVYLLAGSVAGSAIRFIPRHPLRDDERIVGGIPINITEAPYQVSLQRYEWHSCGGSIISPYHVLTAAHCVSSPPSELEKLVIGSGSHALRDMEKRATVRRVRHPKYDPGTLDYDVSVVKVKDPFAESAVRKPVALVPSGGEPADGEQVVVSGWGNTQNGGDDANLLRLVQVDFMGFESCKTPYPDISRRMICAAVPGGGKDSCQGDSGGPLVIKSSGKQIGIVSWGIGCALKDYPGVYTDIANEEIRSFIDDELKQLVDFHQN